LISGIYETGQATPLANSIIGHVTIDTVYEYTSSFTLVPKMKCIGNTLLTSEALSLMATFPMGTQNADHWNWVNKYIALAAKKAKQMGEWALENKNWLVPAVSAVASLI